MMFKPEEATGLPDRSQLSKQLSKDLQFMSLLPNDSTIK